MDDPNPKINSSPIGPQGKLFFKYYKVITIDHTLVSGTGSHNNFPVLISIFDSDLHSHVQSNGNDIAFSNDTAWLDHEIEIFNQTYNATHAQLVSWVRVPTLSTSMDTEIYMYYGNSTMGSQENPEGVWDTNNLAVHHMEESPVGTLYDSTANDEDLITEGSMTSGDLVNSKIGKGIDFDDGDDGAVSTSTITISQFTFSAWIYPDTVTDDWDGVVNIGHGDGDVRFFGLNYGELVIDDFVSTYTIGSTLSSDIWYHIAVTYDGSTIRGYIDGSFENAYSKSWGQITYKYEIGAFAYSSSYQLTDFFDGIIDEIRIVNISQSAGWIQTEYNNQYDPTSFFSIGNACSVSGHPPNAHYFTYYKEIIVDHTKVSGSQNLINFPVLISSFDEDLHDKVQADGDDIAFSDGLSWFDHELELFNQTYNSTHAYLIAWVRVPILSTTVDTVIRMYFGNSTMVSQENSNEVWDSNYVGVWHLGENSGDSLDSTDYGINGTLNGQVTQGVAGQVGNAYNFEGNDDWVDYGDPGDGHLDFNATNDFSISFWLYFDTIISTDFLVSKRSGTGSINNGFSPAITSSRSLVFEVADGSDEFMIFGSSTLSSLNWHYITIVWDDDNASFTTFYLDGIDDKSTTTGSHSSIDSIETTSNLVFGASASGNFDYSGKLDEVHISKSVRSAYWIKTEYNNQYDPTSFYSFSKEYTMSGNPPNESYFKNYKEITIDHTKVSGSHDLINFPLLISILDIDLQDQAQLDGDDILFAWNGAWLDHEIELYNQTYDITHAQLVAWVSIPRLSATEDTVIRMYYGNTTMESQGNPNGVWRENYLGVWHLSELSGNTEDSTSYGTNGIPSGTIIQGVSGQIGNSYYFDRDGIGTVNMGDPIDGHLDFSDNEDFTIELWVNLDYFYYYTPYLVSKRAGGSTSNQGYGVQVYNDNEGIATYEISSNGPIFGVDGTTSLLDTGWRHVVYVFDEDSTTGSTIYIDGVDDKSSTYGTIGNVDNFNNNLNFRLNGQSTPQKDYMIDGKMDEVRISNVVRSANWIQTEYDNQNDPQSFYTIGSEVKDDKTPPTYSNLIESSDPLELGETETITINASDNSGINQVKIEFEGFNHSMTNIGGNTWYYDTWIPGSVDNYTYSIWIEDIYNNWNSTTGSIEVIDTKAPNFSDLIESADPLQLGQNETISIKVYDSPGSGVNQVLLEYDSSNHTMAFIGGNTWSWSKWKPISLGIHPYTIYMRDMEDNWNVTSGTIEVVSTTAPVIENLIKSPETLELGNNITIFVDVDDNETYVSKVLIELENVNYTMNGPVGTTYNYTWTRSWAGTVLFTIYANDSADNWASYTNSFEIVDTTPPDFTDLVKSEDPLELGNTVLISINSTDLSAINQLAIEFEGSNHSMTNIGGDAWQYDFWTPTDAGNYSFTIWAEDNNSNWGFIVDSILVSDTILPLYSDLTESSTIVELGDYLIISINCTDLAGIKEVSIEYENSNHTMVNIGGDIWQYNSWVPTSVGNHSYKIYITDANNNINFVGSSIVFQDTIIPAYVNMFEGADPLELGVSQTIRIDIFDIAGINQVKIEFEGVNHSMTNIYGDTWQYDSWTPTNWITYQYRIHMEDRSGNWNLVAANMTVQDTISPSQPVFTNSPYGDVSGIIVFDWLDGSDPSGIVQYILLIDNETNPHATPGFVFEFNITNTGPESSYFELSEHLTVGRYYYFLAQVDGVGHQSSYTMGTFNVVSPPNNNLWIYIIIGIIGASVAGLIATATIVKKRTKKEVLPQRKKVPFKVIISHIEQISTSQLIQDTQIRMKQQQALEPDVLTDEQKLEHQINEFKNLGEELFTEGAYLEAQRQFMHARDLLLHLGRDEESKLLSELISGIDSLIEERDTRLELLEKTKIEGDAVKIYENYHDVIEISKKLRDTDGVSIYKSELIQFFQINKSKINELEKHREYLEQYTELLISNNEFEKAAQLYETCEKISQLFVQLDMDEEVANIEKFRSKKADCLKRISQ